MKVKTLLKKLMAADSNADVLIDANGVWTSLAKAEEGVITTRGVRHGTLHAKGQTVVRLVAKAPRVK